MIKCDTMKINPRGHVVAEGGPLQILSEAKLLFCELINREKLSPIAARFAVEAAIEVCKLGNRELSFSEYSAACDIAEKRVGFDWSKFVEECTGTDFPGRTVGKAGGRAERDTLPDRGSHYQALSALEPAASGTVPHIESTRISKN